MRPATVTGLGLLAGAALDALVGDPERGHPVAGYGAAVSRVEAVLYRDSRARGVAFTALCVGAPVVAAVVAERRLGPVGRFAATAATTWAVLGGTSLRREGTAINLLLGAGDLDGARTRVARIVGRDTAELDEAGVARAAVESIAENTSDAVVGPLVWGALAGIPGLLGYRAVNTLDAMVGYRSPRYAEFGWASARLDDLANLVPSRLTALLAAITAPAVGGRTPDTLGIARRDGGKHPSPNSGWAEAAFAGALGVQLGGTNAYQGRVDHRPVIGAGNAPGAGDLRRAVALSGWVTVAATGVAATVTALRRR